MKDKLVTLAVIVAVLGGVTAFNVYVRTPPQTEEQQQAKAEAEEQLEAGRVLAEELAAEAPEEHSADDGHDHSGHDHSGHSHAAVPSGPYTPVYNADWPEATPDLYRLKFVTSKGAFVVEVDKSWAPVGAERIYDLARQNFFDDIRFFRVIPGFMAQFGISGNPAANTYFRNKNLLDEPVTQSNTRGMLTFARGGPNTRGTQLFINFGNNSNLDNYQGFGFPPVGKVVEGMEVVDQINGQYGEMPGHVQGELTTKGNAFLDQNYPGLDYIERVELIEPAPEGAETPVEE